MATTPSAQAPVMLTCVLMLLTCIQISQQQVNFYNKSWALVDSYSHQLDQVWNSDYNLDHEIFGHYSEYQCLYDPNTFLCADGTCVARYCKCDGIVQCPDGSDEKDCSMKGLDSCQDASAEGTLRVSINEVDNQATIDASPNEYRAGLGLAGNTQSIGLQFDANTNAQLPPAEYFALESGPRSGSVTGREWFLRLKKPIDRDGGRPDSLDDSTVFEYYLQCTDLTINTPGDPNVAASILARDQDTLNTPIIFSVVLSEPRGYENSFKLRVSTWQVQASTG